MMGLRNKHRCCTTTSYSWSSSFLLPLLLLGVASILPHVACEPAVDVNSATSTSAVLTPATAFYDNLQTTTFYDNLATVTRLTKPLRLRPGEVTNSYHSISIPAGPIAIYGFAADVVEKDKDGNIIPVPLSDAYLHHHVVFSRDKSYKHMKHWWSPMKPKQHDAMRGVGFGAGTESRGTPQRFYHPFAFTTVEGEDELVANVHIINTRGMDTADAGHCLECPCSTHDRYSTNGTILGSVSERRLDWETCNAELVLEQNSACSPDTYYGGLLCCEEGEYCLDKYDRNLTNNQLPDTVEEEEEEVTSTYYLRYTMQYTQKTEENRPVYLASCCDATGNETVQGNIEYDIPKRCDEDDSLDDNDDCVHTLNTVQALHKPKTMSVFSREIAYEEERYVDVVYMVGHLHRGGLEISAYNNLTGELMCQSKPTYGRGKEIRNENGYIVAMSTCTFDPPLRMKTTDPIFITSSYDARKSHTGVMSLFYIAIADVDDETITTSDQFGFWKGFVAALLLVAVAYLAVTTTRYVSKQTHTEYELVPNAAIPPEQKLTV